MVKCSGEDEGSKLPTVNKAVEMKAEFRRLYIPQFSYEHLYYRIDLVTDCNYRILTCNISTALS